MVLLLDSETTEPPLGDGLPMTTVPVEFVPPLTVEGLRVTDDKPGDVMVRIAEAVPPAVIVAVVLVAIGTVVMVNVPADAPPGTVILVGT